MHFGRNPFEQLNDLPDQPRLGVKLMIFGAALTTIRIGWPRVASASFQKASEIFFALDRHIPYRYSKQPSVEDFGMWLAIAAVFCIVAGAFIFLRRGFWWVAENRHEEGVTEIKFK